MMVLLETYQLGRNAAQDNATRHRKDLEYCNRWPYRQIPSPFDTDTPHKQGHPCKKSYTHCKEIENLKQNEQT